MDVIYEKIKPNRKIEIPKEIMERLHLKVGEEIALSVTNRKLLIKPARSVIDEVVGTAKLEDAKLIDKIIEDTEFRE